MINREPSIGIQALEKPDPEMQIWIPLEPSGEIGVDAAGCDVYLNVEGDDGRRHRASVDNFDLRHIRTVGLRVHFQGSVSVIRNGRRLEVYWCNRPRGHCCVRSFAIAVGIAMRYTERHGGASGPNQQGHVEESTMRVDPRHTKPEPEVIDDNGSYLAVQGEDLATGVVGYGATKDEALAMFQRKWDAGERPIIVEPGETVGPRP